MHELKCVCVCLSVCDIAEVPLCWVEQIQLGIRRTSVRSRAGIFVLYHTLKLLFHFSSSSPIPVSYLLLKFFPFLCNFFFSFCTHMTRAAPSSSFAWLDHKYSSAQHTLTQTYSVIKLFQGQFWGLALRGGKKKVRDNATSKLLQTCLFPCSFRWIKAT